MEVGIGFFERVYEGFEFMVVVFGKIVFVLVE